MSEPKSASKKPDKQTASSKKSGAVRSSDVVLSQSRRPPSWLQVIRDCMWVNWQAKLIALMVAFVVWYLVRVYVDQERGFQLPPDFHPGVASALTSPPVSDTVARSR